ncbi:hypothetical protein PUNSTDRAFT_146190 [Punctularia strigosozonata HHB-11173 SS5]|uniref:GST N-terminal domain-containing protein n=1 Tax=Punctularia strigosozonata (strain HHB-11173) TaxID=741275 RepID=R7S3U6_PUNST|nr:uncharacterized protein PUNSTDRAFT_146190 [Punctularia strigosozonata HHB-11173 SS5]EIN04878.1 hypothetical protein PUNSTDRAFT_146190 [Punctularia strigosozonata HHB-11173 SS5]
MEPSQLQAVAAYSGIEVTVPEFEYERDKHALRLEPWFLANFPLGKIRVFEAADGFTLYEIILDSLTRAKYSDLIRHFESIVRQPQFAPIFGEPNFTDRPLAYTPPQAV